MPDDFNDLTDEQLDEQLAAKMAERQEEPEDADSPAEPEATEQPAPTDPSPAVPEEPPQPEPVAAKTVPLEEHVKLRKRAQEAEAELRRIAEEREQVKVEPEDPQPDADSDPIGHLAWQNRQLARKLEAIETKAALRDRDLYEERGRKVVRDLGIDETLLDEFDAEFPQFNGLPPAARAAMAVGIRTHAQAGKLIDPDSPAGRKLIEDRAKQLAEDARRKTDTPRPPNGVARAGALPPGAPGGPRPTHKIPDGELDELIAKAERKRPVSGSSW